MKFRPGGFRPFLGPAVSKLARRLFGDAVLIKPSPKKVEAFLRDRLPAPDEWPCCLAGCELGKRSPQRCAEYVVASPKWAIRRYRLHEAIEKRGRAELAAELGDSIRRT